MKKVSKEEVIQANKNFYDISAEFYEDVDGRRDGKVVLWLSENLSELQKQTQGSKMLDIGCGSGFVMRCGKSFYKEIYGVDVSEKILEPLKNEFTGVYCTDGSSLPFPDSSIDVITCFAALHHMYEHKSLVNEVYRVLKPGGIFYSDHDMERTFMLIFYIPMFFYRKINNMGKKYMSKSNQITRKMYETTEIHSRGISATELKKLFVSKGFSKVENRYHWYGLSPFFNKLMGKKNFVKGFAPLFSIRAQK